MPDTRREPQNPLDSPSEPPLESLFVILVFFHVLLHFLIDFLDLIPCIAHFIYLNNMYLQIEECKVFSDDVYMTVQNRTLIFFSACILPPQYVNLIGSSTYCVNYLVVAVVIIQCAFLRLYKQDYSLFIVCNCCKVDLLFFSLVVYI